METVRRMINWDKGEDFSQVVIFNRRPAGNNSAALAGNLDLDFLARAQIFGGDAKAA